MKTIRHKIFETNSSSSHSVSILSLEDYKLWKSDHNLCYDFDNHKIVSKENRDNEIKKRVIEQFKRNKSTFFKKVTEEDIQDEFEDDPSDYPLTYQEYLDFWVDDNDLDMNIFKIKDETIVTLCTYGYNG